MQRRRVLTVMAGGAAALVSGICAACRVATGAKAQPSVGDKKVGRVTILHTNDLHGHLTGWEGWEGPLKGRTIGGVSRLATAIRQVRKEAAESVVLLDAGDLIGDTMIADFTREALIAAFNLLGYDAMTLGNHEPDFGIPVFGERRKEAQFPFVAANMASKVTFTPPIAPYVIKNANGLRIGIIGLAYPNTRWTTAAKNVQGVTFEGAIPAIERQLPRATGWSTVNRRTLPLGAWRRCQARREGEGN